ncbi:MAG TPA: hypothetical protein VGH87_17820 [Polyangiaceae bacterium]|jgi:hypothetical protein
MTKKDASKAEFVRGLPENMPAKNVVEKAKEAGLKLTPAYVYVIRSQARTGGKKSSSPDDAPRVAGPRGSGMEAKLIATASEIGLTRSIDLLTREKERVMKLLR